MIMRIRIVTLLSLWLATIVFGCDVPERPKVVKVSNASAFRPVHPNEVEDIQSAMRAIITLCRDDLGLPVVDPLFLHLYKNTASFWFFGIGRRTLFDREEFAAISHENTIHINLEKTGNRLWGPSLPLLAHEYAHNVNYALAGNTIKGPIWFAEGFAEWVAAKVIDGLGWQSYAITLNRSTRELAHYRDFIDGLYRLQDKQDWDTALHKPNGSIRTYGLAFVTVDRLIAKKGLSSVVQYIKSGDFQSSFSDLQVNYKIVPHELSSGLEESKFSINRPEWKIGHYWIYQQRIFGTTLTVRKEIIREDSVQGLPVFVIKAGNDEELYAAGKGKGVKSAFSY